MTKNEIAVPRASGATDHGAGHCWALAGRLECRREVGHEAEHHCALQLKEEMAARLMSLPADEVYDANLR